MRVLKNKTKITFEQAVDEILHYVWDPIGIAGIPQCRDEYSSYTHLIVRKSKVCTRDELIQCLLDLELHSMGIKRGLAGASRAVDAILDWDRHTSFNPST